MSAWQPYSDVQPRPRTEASPHPGSFRRVGCVTGLFVYPVKSLAGSFVGSGALWDNGLEHDRMWMVVDESGAMLTQRTVPRMATVQARAFGDYGLDLSDLAGAHGTFRLQRRPRFLPTGDVTVWKQPVPAIEESPEASAWLSSVLGVACRLVRFHAFAVPRDPAGWARSSFADGAPLMLATEATLAALNAAMPEPLPMGRFRPNVVIDGEVPWVEESWRALRLGDVPVRVLKPCRRCTVLDVDPASGEASRGTFEALRGLRAADGAVPSADGKPYFGLRLVHESLGSLRVGDHVYAEPL